MAGRRPNRRGGGGSGGSKRHQKRNKGPKAPEDERLWRRMTQHFTAPEQWLRMWSGRDIAEFLTQRERLESKHDEDEKAARAFQSKMDEAVAFGRTRQQHLVSQGGRTVRFRTPAEIDELRAAASRWKDFFSRHSGKGKIPLGGQISLLESKNASPEDQTMYALLEDAWMAMLIGDDFPPSFTLNEDGVKEWDGFDLVKEAKRCAQRRSGLRFREDEPSLALLLFQAGRFNLRSLLDSRLTKRRKDGFNPFPPTYDIGLVSHAENLPEVDGDGEVASGRTDLRHLPLLTIDPPDARDFDDAVCLTQEKGTRTLWVAIADVAHYVRPGTSLDRAARARATSVYLPHTVLPMLPPRLADDLCSLRAGVDRLAMVIAMDLDGDNNIINTHAYEAVIHVSRNLAYGDVMTSNEHEEMLALAGSWQKREIRMDLNNAELRPRLRGDDEMEVEVKWPNKATKMIESFMVATNAAVGHLLGEAEAPLPWRCHAPPDGPEVESLNARLAAMNIAIELPMPSVRRHGETEADELSNLLGAWADSGGGNIDLGGLSNNETDEVPDYLANVLDPEAREGILTSLLEAQQSASQLADTTRRVVDQGLFQLMQRANYSEENGGHFGLNLDAYVHFTSPIRRYPDLMAHRQLKAFLHETDWAHDFEETAELAEHCSQQGLMAKRLEWELVSNAYHVHLLRGGRIGEDGTANITSYNSRVVGLRTPWVFLDLADDGAVSGRMHLAQLGGKRRLVIDDHGLEVTTAEPDEGGDFPILLRLGQRFACRLRGLDIWSGSLDLAPV